MNASQLNSLLALLSHAQQQKSCLSYRDLVLALDIAAPAIQRLAKALEQLQAYDYKQGQPMRAALVVSQRSPQIPREGFFDCYQDLTGEVIKPAQRATWHALYVQSVYQFSY